MSGRVMFYVQHLLGIGHLRRAEILAKAMVAEGLTSRSLMAVAGRGSFVSRRDGCASSRPRRSPGKISPTLLDEAGRPVDEAWRAAREDCASRPPRRA